MLNRERWLEVQLDREDLPEDLRNVFDKELDSIAEARTKVQEAAKAVTKAALDSKIARLTEIRQKILDNDGDFIMNFGAEEFGEDYEICEEGKEFVVHSKVARDFQESRRSHATMELAVADLRYLYWNRPYSKYVRSGELGELLELVHKP